MELFGGRECASYSVDMAINHIHNTPQWPETKNLISTWTAEVIAYGHWAT